MTIFILGDQAVAQATLELSVPQRSGERGRIFKKHRLIFQILHTLGGAESQ